MNRTPARFNLLRPALCALLILLGFAESSAQPPVPLSEQAYLGLSVREFPDEPGCVVSWIFPGPLEGRGFESPHLRRGDLVLSVGGRAVETPDELKAALAALPPGRTTTLSVLRTQARTDTAVPTPGSAREAAEISIVLASRAEWSGPVAFVKESPPAVVAETPEQSVLLEIIEREIAGAGEDVERLRSFLKSSLDAARGANMLSRVAWGIEHPLSLAALQQTMTDPLPALAQDPSQFFAIAAANLDLEPPVVPRDSIPPADPATAVARLSEMVTAAKHRVDEAFVKVEPARREALQKDIRDVLGRVLSDFYINNDPEIGRLLETLRLSMEIDQAAMLRAAAEFAPLLETQAFDATGLTVQAVPEDLIGAVLGDIVAARQTPAGWVVYGGPRSNTYDLSRVAAVIDPGGDDTYRYPATRQRPDVQCIVDLAGNDRYIAEGESDGWACGPASAVAGVSILVDVSGDDRYEGRRLSAGSGVFGIGLLVDRGGNDQYRASSWSLGFGMYGSGAILDLGNGSDYYEGEVFTQGVGCSGGFGLVLDEAGRDLYRANGPVASAYGTPAVFQGFSQGVGFGIRQYDTGGIGMVADLGGDDRYEAGEFSQGGGYYWALGVLYDRAGRDLYYGNRYGQAYAAHQALGILADDAGDDTYWSMTAASQSGAWDTSATLLIDRAGDDSYQSDGLALGGASQQAVAMFVDLAGRDRYVAGGGATMGQSGDDAYHWDASKAWSLSVFLDLGGADDLYSRSDRGNGRRIHTGQERSEAPASSDLHGFFLDLDAPLESAGAVTGDSDG